MVSYAKRIRDLREDLDIKQEKIAKVLHTTQSQYSKIELGKRKISAEEIIELCILYDVSADYLLGFTNEKKRLPKQ
jgi:transcriptional regulator with XRE-family HTH domain